MKPTSISIVIPSYNEAENIVKTVSDIAEVVTKLDCDYEILVVNDGSSDGTGDIVRNQIIPAVANVRLVEHFPNRGYGGALRAGFDASIKELIAFTPGDGQFDFQEITRLLNQLTTDIVLVSGIRTNRQDNIVRRLNGFLWNSVVRLLFGKLIPDIDCGFKVFRRDILSKITLTSNGAMVDTEMLAKLKALGYQFAAVPVTHLPRIAGTPTGANITVIIKAFRDLFRVRRELSQWKKSF
jgi:dolichol-phosphate mannosyltransferase